MRFKKTAAPRALGVLHQRKADLFHDAELKNWPQFEKDLKTKGFQKAMISHGLSDEKLKSYVENYGAFLTARKVVGKVKSFSSAKMHTIKKLPSGRLGCSCRDWQYKHSHQGTDCKHIRSLAQGTKMASSKFLDGEALRSFRMELEKLAAFARPAVSNIASVAPGGYTGFASMPPEEGAQEARRLSMAEKDIRARVSREKKPHQALQAEQRRLADPNFVNRAQQHGLIQIPSRQGHYLMPTRGLFGTAAIDGSVYAMPKDVARNVRAHELTHFLRNQGGHMAGLYEPGTTTLRPGFGTALGVAREELVANLRGAKAARRAGGTGAWLKALAQTPGSVIGSTRAAYAPHGGILRRAFGMR